MTNIVPDAAATPSRNEWRDAIRNSKLPRHETVVANAMSDFWRSDSKAHQPCQVCNLPACSHLWVVRSLLSERSRYSASTVKRALKGLQIKGWLAKVRDHHYGRRESPIYEACIPRTYKGQNEPCTNVQGSPRPLTGVKMNPVRGQNEPSEGSLRPLTLETLDVIERESKQNHASPPTASGQRSEDQPPIDAKAEAETTRYLENLWRNYAARPTASNEDRQWAEANLRALAMAT